MLGNILSPSPEALAAQKEQKAADRDARSDELERLRGLLDEFTNEKKIASWLPEDVEWGKKFLKGRISTIQSQATITEDKLLALKNDKESQKFENLYESLKIRATFKKEFEAYKQDYNDKIEELKKAKKPVPPEFGDAIKICDEAIAWLKKSMFETSDVYADKKEELESKFKAKHPSSPFGDVEKSAEAAEAERCKKRDEFSVMGLFEEITRYVGGYLSMFLIFVGMVLGSSLAVNLNLYRNWAFRILYAGYGAVFFFVVIPYVLGYRWAYLGKKPKFYSLIPLFPYHWDNRFMQILFGWISYRPDLDIGSLREWENIGK